MPLPINSDMAWRLNSGMSNPPDVPFGSKAAVNHR